jgi:adenylate cyclase
MGSLFQELKRRKVFKVGAVYLVLGWLLIEVTDTVFPQFEFPLWTNQFVTLLVILGFPVAIFFSWAFDLTSHGIVKTNTLDADDSTLSVNGVAKPPPLISEPDGSTAEFASLTSEKSIAVLPLENLSPDPDNAYFAAGVHEEILNQLAKISAIKVISRTAVLRYQDTKQSPSDIAHELNVNTIMEGSVRFADNRVRITTQLIRAIDDIHLWSETYQFELDDIFAIQSDVAKQIANAMQATLSPEEIASIERPATGSMEAYTLFLQARHQMETEKLRLTPNKDGWVEAGILEMERAIDLDPLFARGFAELGFLKWWKAITGPFEEENGLFDEAVVCAKKAIEIDATIARAYIVLQQVSFNRRQWTDWERYARKSVELSDLDGRAALNFAQTLSRMEQYKESYHWFDVAISKEPFSAYYREFAIRARINGRDYEKALVMAEQYLAVGGDENAYHVIRAYTLNRLDRKAESLKEISKISTKPMVVSWAAIPGYHDYLRCQSGEQNTVMEELESLESEFIKEQRIVYCAAGSGDSDAMFDSFQRTMSRGQTIHYNDVVSDEVRADPRWQEVKDYMGFPVVN